MKILLCMLCLTFAAAGPACAADDSSDAAAAQTDAQQVAAYSPLDMDAAIEATIRDNAHTGDASALDPD